MSKKRWTGRLYLGRDTEGKQIFKWVGRFDTKRERDATVAKARFEHERGGSPKLPTCDAYVDRYLADYERRNKYSSYMTQREHLKRFKADFASRSLDIPRAEAKDWVNGEGRWEKAVPMGYVSSVVSLYNWAIDEDDLPLERNPFRKLGKRSRGNADKAPPTKAQFQTLVNACSALGDYAPMMRAYFLFVTYTLMRPSEAFELQWTDIDFKNKTISKDRRLFRGDVDVPKTGKKVIALTPYALDAIAPLSRDSKYVFRSKKGKRLSQPTVSQYWAIVTGKAGFHFAPYHATKHMGVHYMRRELGMSEAAIAAQAGWKTSTVRAMLDIYGHEEIGALAEVHAAFEDAPRLAVVEG